MTYDGLWATRPQVPSPRNWRLQVPAHPQEGQTLKGGSVGSVWSRPGKLWMSQAQEPVLGLGLCAALRQLCWEVPLPTMPWGGRWEIPLLGPWRGFLPMCLLPQLMSICILSQSLVTAVSEVCECC